LKSSLSIKSPLSNNPPPHQLWLKYDVTVFNFSMKAHQNKLRKACVKRGGEFTIEEKAKRK
jgi:hypothetical protein